MESGYLSISQAECPLLDVQILQENAIVITFHGYFMFIL